MLETLYHTFSSFIIPTIFLAIFLIWTLLTPRRSRTMPPGPPPKFLFGNMGMARGKASERINSLLDTIEKYGHDGVCTFYMGNKPMVFVTNYETIKRVVNDDNFTLRPKTFRDQFFHRKGLIFTDGELWKEQRRFALSTLRDLGMGKNWLQDLIIEEAKALVEDIKSKESQPINPTPFLTTSVSNVICAIAYGKRFDHNDAKFRRLTALVGQNAALDSANNLAELFPVLRYIPFSPFRAAFTKFRSNFNEILEFLGELVAEHKTDFQPGEKTDYINAYMNEALKQKDNPKTSFTAEQLQMSIANLFGAGTETTSTTLAWAIIYLVNHPKVYEKLQKEVDAAIPDGGFAYMEEKDSLPYLQATIMEVQRMANLVPIVGRCNAEATEINGYSIPADTVVVTFFSAVHMDEKYFPESHKFNPERFLDSAGTIKKVEGFIPFSVGKRYCIGESLAKMELYIFFASLVRHFNIKTQPGQTLSTMDSILGIVNAPKPYQVIFQPR